MSEGIITSNAVAVLIAQAMVDELLAGVAFDGTANERSLGGDEQPIAFTVRRSYAPIRNLQSVPDDAPELLVIPMSRAMARHTTHKNANTIQIVIDIRRKLKQPVDDYGDDLVEEIDPIVLLAEQIMDFFAFRRLTTHAAFCELIVSGPDGEELADPQDLVERRLFTHRILATYLLYR